MRDHLHLSESQAWRHRFCRRLRNQPQSTRFVKRAGQVQQRERPMKEDFDVRLVDEAKYYQPAPEYKQNAWTDDYERAYAEFLADPVGFWERQAHHLEWIRPWSAVREWDYPYARWFVGARLNITHNCLDRHIADHRRNKVALIWRGDEGEERIYTYHKLWREVNRFANGCLLYTSDAADE